MASTADTELTKRYLAAPGNRFNIKLGSNDTYYNEFDRDRAAGCIRDVAHAYSKDGGLAVLYGNIAKDGSIVKNRRSRREDT